MNQGWHLQTPATTANLGPGFDSLGLALDLCNETWIRPADEDRLEVEGEGADELGGVESNAVLSSFRCGLHALGVPQMRVHIRQHNRIPLARGLGSSAAAIVTGLAAARAAASLPYDAMWLLEQASRLEGHPDNVAPAIYGGLVAAWTDPERGGRCVTLEAASNLAVAVAWPELRVATREARGALPSSYPRADVAFNLGRLALLLRSLASGDVEGLQHGVADRVHTPYRSPLIPGCSRTFERVHSQGGAGFISGSGPTLGALADLSQVEAVADALRAGFLEAGLDCRVHWQPLIPSRAGCRVEAHP